MFTSPFFRRLFVPYLILMWVGIGAAGIFGALHIRASYLQSTQQALWSESRLVAERIADSLKRGDVSEVAAQVKRLGAAIGCRITIVDSEGRVIADNEAAPDTMDNHGSRPEIVMAAAQGDGDSIRHSDTIHADLLYFAHRLQLEGDGVYFVRLAVHLSQLDSHLRVFYAGWGSAAGLAMLATGIISFYLARRHAAPLVQLNAFANALARGDLKSRILRPPAGEMGSLALSLNAMADSLSGLLSQAAKDKAELSAILESMSEGVIATNLKQQILLVNDSAGRLLGFPPAGATGKLLWEVVRDQQILKAVREMSASETSAADRRTTVQVGPIAGRTLEITVSVFPASGEPQGLAMVAHDITESSRYQELRKEFVANVSHELRTPLTVIRGFLETLRDGAMQDPVKGPEFLATIQKHADQLTNLVSDLLDLSRLESQPGMPQAQRVNVGAVVRKSADLLLPAAAKKHQQLIVSISGGLPEVIGNPDYLERAVCNLIDNATKYTRENGQINVSATLEDGEVVITVADNGLGIPLEDLARIFERFYRVDRSRSREMGGTGLGLSIVKHVAQVHGGTIEVQSTPGAGSTFRLKIPCGPA